MKMKKLGALALVLMMGMSMAACGGNDAGTTDSSSEPAVESDAAEATEEAASPDEELSAESTTEAAAEGKKLALGMITDVGGVNDQSFNQSSWEGMQMAEEQLGAEISYLESKTDADYEPNIETMLDQDKDLIIGVGFKLGPGIQKAAETYDDQQFAIIDFAYTDEEVPNKNITGLVFKANECSYLVGYIAGKVSQSGKIGFVSGMDSTTMNSFGYGYYAGILAARPDATIYGQYADAFNDPAKGKAIANQMYSDGADVIFACAGDTGNGVIEAAKEKNLWVIGVDRDQNYLAPENVLTSAIKRVDMAVLDVSKRMSEGNLPGGETLIYGLDSQGVGIAPTSDKNVPADVLTEVKDIEAKIISGEIKVPDTEEEFKQAYPDVAFMK